MQRVIDGHGPVAHLPVLLVKVHLPLRVVGTQAQVEDYLQVRARVGERNLGVALATPVLEADLSLLLRPVSVACVADLWGRGRGRVSNWYSTGSIDWRCLG